MQDGAKPGKKFEFRQGVDDFPGWSGIQMDSDPGTTERNRLVSGVNIRYDSGNIRNRWGLAEIYQFPSAAGLNGKVAWLGMHHLQFRPPKLWLGCYACLGAGAQPGALLMSYSPDKSPAIQPVANYVAEQDRIPAVGGFSGELYFGDWSVLQRPIIQEPMRGERIAIGVRQAFTDPVAAYDGFEASAMEEFDGKLFIALKDPAGAASRVDYWDGVTLISSDLATGANYGVNFCKWRDGKLVMIQYNTATVQIRDLAGSWSTVALPGVITNQYKNSMCEYRDAIYIANGGVIYKISNYDTPATSTAQTLPANSTATAVAAYGDLLYYLYNVGATTPYTAIWLGMYDPDRAASNWTDSHKQIDTDLGDTKYLSAPGAVSMIEYKNALYVGGNYTSLFSHTVSRDPLSTWAVMMDGQVSFGTGSSAYVAGLRVV